MVSQLANNFSEKEDCKVYLGVYDDKDSAYLLNETVSFIKYRCTKNQIRFRIPLILKIRETIRTNHIDVVIGFSIGASELLGVAKIGICSCKFWGSERSNPYIRRHNLIRKLLQNFVLTNLDGMIFTTEGCRDYYCKNIRKKSMVIPNGYVSTRDEERMSTISKETNKNIIAVGNLRKVKDYPTMISAFKIFSDTHGEYILNIYGEGPERDNILKLIDDYGLSSKVILHGSVNDLNDVYNNSCFLLHSSMSESWCNAILEALSHGVPCIAADCDFGPREMIKNGVNGYLYKVGDVKQLANCMSTLVETQDLLTKMGEAAYNDAKRFDLKIIAEEYFSALAGGV